MKTLIPLPGGKSVSGESRHGRWTVGDVFGYDGTLYQFLGKDLTSALHARRLTDQKLVVFESSNEWNKQPAPNQATA